MEIVLEINCFKRIIPMIGKILTNSPSGRNQMAKKKNKQSKLISGNVTQNLA